jgi:hypothetical protein
VDCQLCVYPGRGGCLDRSEGSLDALVESARAVAARNSIDLGTIIRIKGNSRLVERSLTRIVDEKREDAIWVTGTDLGLL